MMIRQPLKYRTTILLGAAGISIFLLAYTLLSWHQHQINPDDRSVPSWTQLGQGLKYICTPHFRSGKIRLWEDAKASMSRLFLALLFSFVIGFVIGMLGCFSLFRAFVTPLFSAMSQISPTAVIAVLFSIVVMVNHSFPATKNFNFYILSISFGLIPALVLRIHTAIRDMPDVYIYKAYIQGASHFEAAFGIIMRYAWPYVMDGVMDMIGPAFVYLIAAETLDADVGFGYTIRMEAKLVNMDVVFPNLIVLALIGYSIIRLMKLGQGLFDWRESSK